MLEDGGNGREDALVVVKWCHGRCHGRGEGREDELGSREIIKGRTNSPS